MSGRLLLVVALAAPVLLWRLDRPGFSDTEGMFAEPAREMVATGDWVTPRMNGQVFLTKPPLMYWLPAAVFAVVGPTEYARIWPVLGGLATVAVTGALGTELFGTAAGLAAAIVLATSVGFFLEARLLRADMVLVLMVTTALWSYVRLRHRPTVWTAIALWAAISVGMLDKGLLALLLPAGVIAVTEAAAGELRPRTVVVRLHASRPALGLAVIAAIALPWHLAAAARNPGFLWDYVVNQHLLFFFDAKLPRDSIPDSLSFFWTMFVARGLPWSLLVPAALLHAWRTRGARPGVGLLGAWLAVVLGFFSFAAGRLEHYSLPALPAVALALGLLLSDAEAGSLRVARGWLAVPPVLAALAAALFAGRDAEAFLGAIDPTLLGQGLQWLVRPTLLPLATGLLMVALFFTVGRVRLARLTAVATALGVLVCVQLAHERLEPLFSWRPFARAIRDARPGARVFFRASDEYQLCGGLDYYLGGPVAILAPAHWVPPTFLVGRTDRLFTPPAELLVAWRRGEGVLVADDVPGAREEKELAPGPYATLLRAGARVVLVALPEAARRAGKSKPGLLGTAGAQDAPAADALNEADGEINMSAYPCPYALTHARSGSAVSTASWAGSAVGVGPD